MWCTNGPFTSRNKTCSPSTAVYWRMAKFSLVHGEVKIHRRNHSAAEAWQLETSIKNIIRGTARSSAPSFGVRIFYYEAASHGIDWVLRLSLQEQFIPITKLGKAVESNSPQFIMSQFISKTKTDIQKHLVLKAEEYKDLSEIIEAAKRIERSFSPGGGHSNTNKPPLDPPNALNITPTPPVPDGRRKKPFCYHCHSPGHIKSSCPKRTVKTPSPGNSQHSNEVSSHAPLRNL